MSTTTTDGLRPGIDETEYHADPALSQSGAKLLLESPARYRWQRDAGEQKRDVFDFGHAAHGKVLGEGRELVIIDADDWRSKAAREAKDAAHAEGKTPLLRKDAAKVDAMAAKIEEHPGASAILRREGVAESSMWWTETVGEGWAAFEVPCRGRIDWLTTTADGRPCIVDYKSTADASPDGFAKSAANFRYDMQEHAYRRGLQANTGDDAAFVFIAQEKEPPFLVGLYVLDADFRIRGEQAWQRALEIYARCASTDTWPGYAPDITELTMPRWAN